MEGFCMPVSRGVGYIGFQYFLYFGVMGVFLPYFNLHCYHLGFSGFEIGVISAVRAGVMIFASVLWGKLADRLGLRHSIYLFCSFASMSVWGGYFFVKGFSVFLLVTIVYTIFYAPIIGFLEAITMESLGRQRDRYGRVRVWGSFSFLFMVIVTGKLTDRFQMDLIIPLILFGLMIQSLFAVKLPRPKSSSPKTAASGRPFFNRRLVYFLICAFLMLVSHGTYYGYFSIHIENLGYSRTFIGLCWAVAVGAETVAMVFSPKLFRQVSLEKVLFWSLVSACLRWVLLFRITSPMALLFSQVLHAMTYGTFHMAGILYIDSLMPPESKTTGQTLNNAVTYGLGMMVGFVVNGYFYEKTGVFNLFFISGIMAFLGAVLFRFTLYNSSGN